MIRIDGLLELLCVYLSRYRYELETVNEPRGVDGYRAVHLSD